MYSGIRGNKQSFSDGDEYDGLCKSSRRYYSWRAGDLRVIKRRVNKRFRKAGSKSLREEVMYAYC